MPETPDDLLPIGEAARLVGLSVDTLREYDRSGKLPCVRTAGNQRRFRRIDVENLLRPSETSDAAGPSAIPSALGPTSTPEVDQ